MYKQQKPSKSPSVSKQLTRKMIKSPSRIDRNGKGTTYLKHQKKIPKAEQNIYYTSTCAQTEDQVNIKSYKSISKRQQFTKIPLTNHLSTVSSESSISSISLKRHDLQNPSNVSTPKMMKVNPQNNTHIIERTKSPKNDRHQKIKNLSTKTSIKEIEQIHSSHSFIPQSPESQKNIPKKPLKDSTLEITMKHMFRELKSTRQQNSFLKEQLIRIKAHEYYYLNREKVKEMVMELDQQKRERKNLEKENIELREQKAKLKQQNLSYKKENYRMKRINAQMKDEIAQIHQQNFVLRQRANQDY